MKLKDIVNKVKTDSRKLTQYALNLDNPKGLNKALMFHRYLGYTQDNYEPLLGQIADKALEANAIYQSIDLHGQLYQVDLEITEIKPGQKEIVRTGWIVEPDSDTARLVTLYVSR
ncbi:MAG: DUF6883 domain-containing protein [Microcystis panniformis]